MSLRFLAIGDNAVDTYPAKGVGYAGGQAFNAAYYSHTLGLDAAYLGVFGRDSFGDFLKATATANQIDISHCATRYGENCYSAVSVTDGERSFGPDNRGGVQRMFPLQLTPGDLQYIASFDFVHMTRDSYVDHLLKQVSQTGVPLSYDFSDNYTDERLRSIAPLLSVSILSMGSADEQDIVARMKQVNEYGSPIVVATRGAAGSLLYDGTAFYSFGIIPCTVCDTLAAGDSFAAGVLSTLAACPDALRRHGKAVPLDPALAQKALQTGAALSARALSVPGGFGVPIDL